MLKAVFDTNIFFLALINPHSRCGRLLDELATDYELDLLPSYYLRDIGSHPGQPAARALVDEIGDRFPRHRAFQTEFKTAVQRMERGLR